MALIAALFAAALASAPTDWPSVGGFDVVPLDGSCALKTTYLFDGRAPVHLLVLSDAEEVAFGLFSGDWSTVPGQEYEITYAFDDTLYSGPSVGVIDPALASGFSSYFRLEILNVFAAARNMLVMRGDDIVTHVRLSGSALAVAALRRCVDTVRRENAAQARRESRWGYIAQNPFPRPAVSEVAPPRPSVITNPRWEKRTAPDFPARALAQGIEAGTVRLSCTMSSNGSLTNCAVSSEAPAGFGFGPEALRAAETYRVSPSTVSGAASGATVQFTEQFTAPGR